MDEETKVSQGEDVTEATQTEETDTSTTSSSENKTDQVTGGDGAPSTKGTDGKYVPYERFDEVNKAKKELEERIKEFESKAQVKPANPEAEVIKEQLKPILKEMGFIDKDELQKTEEDKALRAELTRLEGQYSGKDGRPKFDRDEIVKFALDNQIGSLESAYKLRHEAELINWHIKEAQTKSKGIKTESSNGTGSSEAGVTNDDLKVGIQKGDKTALRTYLKRFVPKS